jgi:hypothetical protein
MFEYWPMPDISCLCWRVVGILFATEIDLLLFGNRKTREAADNFQQPLLFALVTKSVLFVVQSVAIRANDHHLFRVGEVYNIRYIDRIKIDINQFFGVGSIADYVRSFASGWESNGIASFYGNVSVGSTHNADAADNVKNFLAHFMIMIAEGIVAGLHFNEIGSAFVCVIMAYHRLNGKLIAVLAPGFSGHGVPVFYCQFFHVRFLLCD